MNQEQLAAECAKYPELMAAKLIVLESKVKQGDAILNAARIKIKALTEALWDSGCMYHDSRDMDKGMCCCQGCSEASTDTCDCPRCQGITRFGSTTIGV